jgi:hypothetical protein
MITLTIGNNAKSQGVELNNNGRKEIVPVLDLAKVLRSLRLGTTITVNSENTRVKSFKGTYYVLFMEEFEEVIIFYQDSHGNLRQVFTDNEIYISKGLYFLIADGTPVKILKSNNKKAYRVVSEYADGVKVFTKNYKNKSSEIVGQTYLDLFTAIKYATLLHSKEPNRVFQVITPKETVLYQVG